MRASQKHGKTLLGIIIAIVASLTLASCGSPDAKVEESREEGVPAVKVVEESHPAVKVSEKDGGQQSEAKSEASSQEELRVRFIDVGQGDCTLITCGGEALLVDGGDPSSSSKVYSILETLGITYIDHIVSTHTDSDHCGGLSGALQYAKCGVFYSPTAEQDTKTWNSILNRLESQGVSVTIPSPGDSFPLGSATVTILGPIKKSDDDNNNSIVLRVDHGSNSFLLTGDAETEEENDLIASSADLDVDVLKVGHHGSSSSTGSTFLKKITPEYAVISVGDNGYGHPTDKTLSKLKSNGATVYRTDVDGNVIAISDGTTLTFEKVKGRVNE